MDPQGIQTKLLPSALSPEAERKNNTYKFADIMMSPVRFT